MPGTAVATFAGGCFWCVEADFDKVPGVLRTISGYTGGKADNPTYKQVISGSTGHTEAVEITFDPSKVGYQKLLDVFWRNHDPLARDRQFCDTGNQYRPAIFFHGEAQQKLAEETKKAVQTKFAPRVGAHRDPRAEKFYRPRTITRTITRKIRCATNSIASIAAAISVSRNCGVNRQES